MKLSFLILLSSVVLSPITSAFQEKEKALITELKQHYAFVEKMKKLSVNYAEKTQTTFQSNSFNTPSTIKSKYEYQYDLDEQQFYFHQQHVYPGNFIFNDKIVHKNGKSILYDVNGFTMGKQLQVIEYPLPEFKKNLSAEIDILAAHQFLASATNMNTEINKTKSWAELSQLNKNNEKVTYRFQLSPIRLHSITFHKSNSRAEFTKRVRERGYTYASAINHFRDGVIKRTVTVSKLQEISGIKQEMLQVPQGYGPFVDTKKKAMQWVKLSNDLYLINYVAGDRHVMVKDSDIGLTVFGAPISSDISKKTTILINKHLPNKNIHSVYITHAHHDHMGGLSHYGNQGIKIITDKHNIKGIKAYPRFKNDVNNWLFQTIEHKQNLNGVTYYAPKNSHNDGQSFAYFLKDEIIYQGDFLEIPFDNSLPTHMADVEKEFIEFLYQEKLPYKRIVGHHRNNNMKPDVVDAYYNAHH